MALIPPSTAPQLNQPLLQEPPQVQPATPTSALGPLEHLVGTWTNQRIPNAHRGGTDQPFSYCVMPLPQKGDFILKNFSYYEEITFSAIHGTAPNRGGAGTQVANTLFYEQRIYFADGPAKDSLVHAENGSWLFLTDREQILGPYGNGDAPGLGDKTIPGSAVPRQQYPIVKQMSVPHGNSILASGRYFRDEGNPLITPTANVVPSGISDEQYLTESVGNLNPALTLNPNAALNAALKQEKIDSFLRFDIDSTMGNHPVSNIAFEQRHADVTRYYATYWLEKLEGAEDFSQLQYTQTMLMDIPIEGLGKVSFPHVTSNTLTKKSFDA